MTKISGHLIVLILLFAIAQGAGQKLHAEAINETKLNWRIDRDTRNLRLVATDRVLELLAIKPGMTILDIGTGTGQFAYEFAERLKGTGKVFATDIDVTCINYVKEEAVRRGLTNLYPVLVKKEGVDGFYAGNKYDLITLIHVSMVHKPDMDYFRELRGFLAEDGRFVLIFNKIAPPFSLSDFTADFRGLIRELSLEPVDSPFYKGLREPTRQLIKQYSGAGPDVHLKNAIVEDFNRILSDNRFGLDFVSGPVFIKEMAFSPEERGFAGSLLLSMIYKKNFERNKKGLHSEEIRDVARFNKLLILQRFRRYLDRDRMFTSMQATKIRDVFEKAGYELLKEHTDVIPFEDILVFGAAKNAERQ